MSVSLEISYDLDLKLRNRKIMQDLTHVKRLMRLHKSYF